MTHLLVFTASSAPSPIPICYEDADEAHVERDEIGGAAVVVRMLTGKCPVCGEIVSTAHVNAAEIALDTRLAFGSRMR